MDYDGFGFDGAGSSSLNIDFANSYLPQFEQIWREANEADAPSLPGSACATVFARSGLNSTILAKIWDLVDTTKSGDINREEFFVALGLIALAQKGEPVTIRHLEETVALEPPHLDSEVDSATANALSPKTNYLDDEQSFVRGSDFVIKVRIGDTQGTLKKHTAYIVTTEPHQWSVTRRFKDFEWLQTGLEKIFPFAVLPSLPVKKLAGRFEENFLEDRRRMLERYLNIAAEHQTFGASRILESFLRDDELAWKSRDSYLQDTTEDYVAYRETIKSVSPPAQDAEASLETIKVYLLNFEKHLTVFYRANEQMLQIQESHAKAMLVSAGFVADMQNTEDGIHLCWIKDCPKCAKTQEGMVVIKDSMTAHAHRVMDLIEPLRQCFSDVACELMSFIKGLRDLYKRKEFLQKSAQNYYKNICKIRDKISQLRLKNAAQGKIDKAQKELEAEEVKYKKDQMCADFVVQTLFSETIRFHKQKNELLRKMMQNKLTNDMIQYAHLIQDDWTNIQTQLDAL
eukprot:GCRY01001900.1.p1 GENE.GCRY01001900.1~~GCRY01001900.1.p1  ORF type:complete len:514 (-),score=64.58 GCRY01001900.1:24-1565(-)